MFTCSTCNSDISDGVKCSKCSVSHCFTCANITEKNYKKLGPQRQAALLCSSCKLASPSHQPGVSNATLELVLQELRDGIKSINVRLDQLPALVNEVKDIRNKLNTLEANINDTKKEVSAAVAKTAELETRICSVEAGCAALADYPQLEKKMSQLFMESRSREQRERLNNVEIKGVPHKKQENLIDITRKVGEVVGQTISPADINFVTRVRSTNPSKPIIVGFVGRYTKENFVAKARAYKNLTTEELGFPGPASRIYVNDHLTRDNKLLLTRTKKLSLEKNYKYTWVQNCKILVRKNDTSPIVQIQSDDELAKLK